MVRSPLLPDPAREGALPGSARAELEENLPQPPADILDAGGGPGRMARALAAGSYQVTLLDPSEAMRERAMVTLEPYAEHSHVCGGTVEEAPQIFGREVFDAVVCYVDALDRAFRGAAAVLQHRGVLRFSSRTAMLYPFHHAAEGCIEEALRVLDEGNSLYIYALHVSQLPGRP